MAAAPGGRGTASACHSVLSCNSHHYTPGTSDRTRGRSVLSRWGHLRVHAWLQPATSLSSSAVLARQSVYTPETKVACLQLACLSPITRLTWTAAQRLRKGPAAFSRTSLSRLLNAVVDAAFAPTHPCRHAGRLPAGHGRRHSGAFMSSGSSGRMWEQPPAGSTPAGTVCVSCNR